MRLLSLAEARVEQSEADESNHFWQIYSAAGSAEGVPEIGGSVPARVAGVSLSAAGIAASIGAGVAPAAASSPFASSPGGGESC